MERGSLWNSGCIIVLFTGVTAGAVAAVVDVDIAVVIIVSIVAEVPLSSEPVECG